MQSNFRKTTGIIPLTTLNCFTCRSTSRFGLILNKIASLGVNSESPQTLSRSLAVIFIASIRNCQVSLDRLGKVSHLLKGIAVLESHFRLARASGHARTAEIRKLLKFIGVGNHGLPEPLSSMDARLSKQRQRGTDQIPESSARLLYPVECFFVTAS